MQAETPSRCGGAAQAATPIPRGDGQALGRGAEFLVAMLKGPQWYAVHDDMRSSKKLKKAYAKNALRKVASEGVGRSGARAVAVALQCGPGHAFQLRRERAVARAAS